MLDDLVQVALKRDRARLDRPEVDEARVAALDLSLVVDRSHFGREILCLIYEYLRKVVYEPGVTAGRRQRRPGELIGDVSPAMARIVAEIRVRPVMNRM